MIRATIDHFERLHRLRGGALFATVPAAVFRVTGTGALTCLQGLWTNDLVEPGDRSLTYGALLTPKGMIIATGWSFRRGESIDLVFSAPARETVAQILKRSLPPRLATAEDLSDAVRVVHLLGDGAIERWPVVPLGRLPEDDHVAEHETAAGTFEVAVPSAAPFRAVLLGAPDAIAAVERLLEAAGMRTGDDDLQEAARILAGWPSLSGEIDERTLPQEVRFDEHGGVSYTKGCYTGQETVARLHFRGHTNRVLRGLRWIGPESGSDQVLSGEKTVGRLTSVLTLPDRVLGLAIVRRELSPGSRVTVGGAPAVVVALPFGTREIEG